MFSDVENDFEKEDPKEKQTKKKKNRDVLRDHAASGITVHVTGGPGPTAPGIPPPMEETGTANPTEKEATSLPEMAPERWGCQRRQSRLPCGSTPTTRKANGAESSTTAFKFQ